MEKVSKTKVAVQHESVKRQKYKITSIEENIKFG